MVVLQLAFQVVGATTALINTSLMGEALRHVIDLSDASLVVTDEAHAAVLDTISRHLGGACRAISTGQPDLAAALRGAIDPSPLLEALGAVGPTDPAFINYTSGTTGWPKGVVIKQIFGLAPVLLARQLGLGEGEDRLYLATPMYHALGLAFTAMTLRLGDVLVIAPRFSATHYWDDIRTHRCTVAYHVGTIARMLYNQPPRPDDAVHELRVFIGGGMPADIWESFAARFGVTVIEGYSASDSVGNITNFGDAPVGSFGRPGPELEVRVVDTADEEVPVGQPGELHLRLRAALPGPLVEYYNDEEAGAEKTRGGWVRTGDLVRRDEAGHLFFVDRQKDVIRRRGVNIAPAEIERILCGDERVLECAALAVAAELGEDDIKLVVVGDGINEREVAALADVALPAYMGPRYIELVGALPKTVTERVQRYLLKQDWRTSSTFDVATGRYLTDEAATVDGRIDLEGAKP
jgi:crotonobetaine/carnitine-CoA ligase